ncbi:PP2C family protein-serine/threonine phosphatase [Desulfohalovibrio reitneri]|uniref:PP2C family protein-serine/threonine phosphatase n=1 Tax=Desulfohalovibrio reitneri TaxID=1307759 RepID=UPI0004A77544|nr:fused response regulator/phosphatase [Desulfohalovibrio reitneri]
MRDAPLVLIVDDEHLNRLTLERMLHREGFQTLLADDGQTGRELARTSLPDIILLDIMMPGESGFETISGLREDAETAAIPVIFISALGDVENKVRGFDLGAVDYVTKPFQFREVLARIRTNLKVSEALRATIREQARRLEQVRDAQEAILVKPESLPDARFSILFEPVLEAGGDFYDVFPRGAGYGYFVADIAGHDLGASFVTSSLKALLRQNATPLYTPVETMTNINGVLNQVLAPGKFLTAAYLQLDRARRRLTLVNAGHPPPVLVSADGSVELLRADGDILGAFERVAFTPLQREVRPGDRIYLYTDGLVETQGGSSPRCLGSGVSLLQDACGELPGLELGESVERLCRAMAGRGERGDDAVVMAVEV